MSCLELVLLAGVFFGGMGVYAWLRKTHRSRLLTQSKPATDQVVSYRLVHRSIRADASEPLPSGNGYYVLRVEDNKRLSWEELPAGLLTFEVAGASRHEEQLQSDAFAPGSSLALSLEPENPYDSNAVKVSSADLSLQVGYVPRELAPKVGRALRRKEVARCIALWEEIERNRRVGLRVLIVRRGIHFSR